MQRISRRSKVILFVVILTLLFGIAAFTIPRLKVAHRVVVPFGMSQQAAIATVKSHIQMFQVCLLSYHAKAGVYPTTEQGLRALTRKPTTGPLPRTWSATMKTVPKDPWGSDYIYQQPGTHNRDAYDISSPGADRIPGTADDIGNWE